MKYGVRLLSTPPVLFMHHALPLKLIRRSRAVQQVASLSPVSTNAFMKIECA